MSNNTENNDLRPTADLIPGFEELGPVKYADTEADRESPDANSDASNGDESNGDESNGDESNGDAERNVPRPPAGNTNRKRPCRKQGGRKQERREGGDAKRRPMQRKLNQYALDPLTGLVTSVRPGQEILKGSRVVEQPAGNAKPSIAAFYDASLLPKGSTVVARWGDDAPAIDADLVARASRLARLAGFGDTACRTMRDQFSRSANPVAAFEAFTLELGGADALTAAPGTVTTTYTREDLDGAIARAVNTGNEKLVELAENLPVRLTPEKRLVDALANLPGMIESLESDGNGCILHVRGIRFDEKAVICQKLRDAGGHRIDVRKTEIVKEGRTLKAYVVSARFNISPIEIAAARTGNKAEIEYALDESGAVNASYSVDLYGETVSTPVIPCEPSWASVELLVNELAKHGDTQTRELLEQLALEFDVPAQAIVSAIGPVRTLEQARAAIATVKAEDILSEGYAENVAKAAREIRATDGRRIPVEYRGGFAVLGEFSFHPTDVRPQLLPENVLVGVDEVPTRVRRVRFETKKGSNRPRIVVEDVEISELAERRDAYLAGKDPQKALVTAVRENFIAEATRSMTSALVNPPETREGVRNPEGLAKSRVISKHLDPYTADGGDLVHLVEVLASSAGDEAWSRWCRENVKAFRDDARERRRQGKPAATDFFAAVGTATHAKSFLLEAGAALLENRLGRGVTVDEFVEIARESRVTKEHVFTAVDRGRALAQYLKRGN